MSLMLMPRENDPSLAENLATMRRLVDERQKIVADYRALVANATENLCAALDLLRRVNELEARSRTPGLPPLKNLAP